MRKNMVERNEVFCCVFGFGLSTVVVMVVCFKLLLLFCTTTAVTTKKFRKKLQQYGAHIDDLRTKTRKYFYYYCYYDKASSALTDDSQRSHFMHVQLLYTRIYRHLMEHDNVFFLSSFARHFFASLFAMLLTPFFSLLYFVFAKSTSLMAMKVAAVATSDEIWIYWLFCCCCCALFTLLWLQRFELSQHKC